MEPARTFPHIFGVIFLTQRVWVWAERENKGVWVRVKWEPRSRKGIKPHFQRVPIINYPPIRARPESALWEISSTQIFS
jgi:hypothetical protein